VTVAGQSSGAFAVNYLMASPLAKGSFQRAIAESWGALTGAQPLKDAEAAGVKFAETQGAATIAELRAKPAEALLRGAGGYRPGPVITGMLFRRTFIRFSPKESKTTLLC
jgi:para-nitrobenzyl esterase